MKSRLETLAGQRQSLVERSALCRLRLRRDAVAVRAAVSWNRVPEVLAAVPATRTIAWSVVFSLLGAGRAARVLMFASRALLVAKVASAALAYARGPSRPV